MRTTVNIDDALLAAAKGEALARGRTLSDVVEDGLRRVLHQSATSPVAASVTLRTHGRGGLRPGIDLASSEQLAEILGENEPRRAAR
ncbi:MAG TPA: CopG family transcriptional regulator [Microbacteriaceae bacterium]|nr:CopG family transcriptional regulator [Microbacteriaceae bacterium]